MKNFKKIFLYIICVTAMVCCFMPSSVHAANKTLTYTYAEGKFRDANGHAYEGTLKKNGTWYSWKKDDPLRFYFDYDEIIIQYDPSKKESKEFAFTFGKSGNEEYKAAKYLVTQNVEEKKIIFKKLATLKLGDTGRFFYVTPPDKVTDIHTLQPGALLHPELRNMSYSQTPTFRILANSYFGGYTALFSTWQIDIAIKDHPLGNSTFGADTVQSNFATHPEVYVFARSEIASNEIFRFSQIQIEEKAAMHVFPNNGTEIGFYTVKDENTFGDNRTIIGKKYTFNSKTTARVDYEFIGITSNNLTGEVSGIESAITVIGCAVYDVLRYALASGFGDMLSIDSLIFNEFSKTKLDFWGTSRGGEYTSVFTNVINVWFRNFRGFAQVVLIIILVAMGIKAMLMAGTSKQNKIKDMLVGWVLAIGLLTLSPYFFKYTIVLNDSIVKIIRNESEYSIYSVYNSDFISRYFTKDELDDMGVTIDDEYKIQFGEDSATKTVQSLISRMKGIIDKKLEVADKRWQEVRNNVEIIDHFNNFIKYMGVDVKFIDVNGVPRNFTQAKREVAKETIRNTDKIRTKNDAKVYVVNDIINEVEVSFLGGSPAPSVLFQREYCRDQYSEYALAYKDYVRYGNASAELEKALAISTKGIDLESVMRTRAGTEKRFIFIVIAMVMLAELLILLFLYFKRLVVTAALIAIFPLVIIMYAMEKLMGISKTKTLPTWIIEFLTNVFIQSIHALFYVVLVETGLKVFEGNPDNWLLFLLAVVGIISVEKIVRSATGLNGATTKNISDGMKRLGEGAAATLAVGGALASIRKSNKAIDNKYDELDKKAEEKYAKRDKVQSTLDEIARNGIVKKVAQGGAGADEAKKRLEAFDKQVKEREENKQRKRDAAKRRRDRMRRMEKAATPVRNVAAATSMITSGLAFGGDAEDFIAAASVGKMISGKRNINKRKSGTNSRGSAPNKASSNSTRQNTSGNNTRNRAAEEATHATTDYGNGRLAPTAAEARAEARAEAVGNQGNSSGAVNSKVQDKFRQNIEGRQEATVNQRIFFSDNDNT